MPNTAAACVALNISVSLTAGSDVVSAIIVVVCIAVLLPCYLVVYSPCLMTISRTLGTERFTCAAIVENMRLGDAFGNRALNSTYIWHTLLWNASRSFSIGVLKSNPIMSIVVVLLQFVFASISQHIIH